MARYGLSARDVLDAVEVAIGGKNVSVTIEGASVSDSGAAGTRRADDIEKIGRILVATKSGMSGGPENSTVVHAWWRRHGWRRRPLKRP